MEYFIVDPTDSIGKLVAKLEAMSYSAVNLGPPLKEIVTDIFRVEESVFASKGRRGGGSWKKLADSTIKRKGHDKILRDTDDLYNSVTQPGAPYQILKISSDSMEFGTERPWAFVHQRGSKHVPARPFIKFTPYDLGRWNAMLTNHLLKSFGQEYRGY